MTLTDKTVTRTVTCDGTEVTYYDSGEGAPGTRPLVLIHGTGGTTAVHFAHLFPMMAMRTRVIGVDFADDGKEPTIEGLAAQVLAAADDALGKDAEFDLLGYSLGTVIAQQIAATQAERVKNLVLVCGWFRTDAAMKFMVDVWQKLWASGDIDAVADYNAFLAFSANYLRMLPPAMMDVIHERCKSDDFAARQFTLDRTVDLGDLPGKIKANTLVVAATQDAMVPNIHQYELLGAIDEARMTWITSGHGVFVERPTEVLQVVDLFLKDPTRYPAGTIIPETHA